MKKVLILSAITISSIFVAIGCGDKKEEGGGGEDAGKKSEEPAK